MTDLDRQLRAYTEILDSAAPPVEALATRGRARPRQRSKLAIAMAGGLAAAVLVGGVAFLSAVRSDDDPVTSSTTFTTTTTTPPDQTTVPVPGAVESEFVDLVSDVPIIAGGGAFERPKVGAGPVLDVDGEYFTVFAVGGDDDSGLGWGTVYWASSPDGSSWTVAPEPLSMPEIAGAADVVVGSLIREGDQFVVYMHVAFDVGGHGAHEFQYSIRRATAPSPTGPWTFDDDPVLIPSDEGWDSKSVQYPSVVRLGDEWRMYYSGYAKSDSEEGPSSIGVATSADGVTWTRRSAPVFEASPESAWEDGGVRSPTVVIDGDRLLMLYSGRTGGVRGLAVSNDGEQWERYDDAPVLSPLDVPRPALFTVSLLNDRGVLRLYVSNGGHRTTSDIYEMVLTLE